ncbi:MAG TPA: hypothetical protein P5525_05110 [Candidatus Paceibacterota bacterium]|nr:hypothetical protein [Candidatus Paceibacterota bacterium]
MSTLRTMLAVLMILEAATLSALAADETHSNLQSVTSSGTSAWNGTFPFTLRGVLLCDPEEMLDYAPNFIPWDNGANAGKMGGEWQVTFQAVEAGDRGGTTCWMGQNYANRVPPHDDEFSYSNPAWVAEINRLNFDPTTGHKFRAGDLVQITARQALFYGGKRNINEGHDVDPSANFDIVLVTPNYGLPAPEVITLADVMEPVGVPNDPTTWGYIFDQTRTIGGEHYQGMRVRINDLTLVTTNGWNPTNLWNDRKCTVTDGAGRHFTIRHPRYSLGPALTNRFDAIGIFTQESGSGIQGTNGYELFAQQIIPQDPPVLGIAQKIAITWPVSGAAYQLEYRTDLNSTNWLPVTATPVVIEGQNTVLVPSAMLPREQYYRLRKTN